MPKTDILIFDTIALEWLIALLATAFRQRVAPTM